MSTETSNQNNQNQNNQNQSQKYRVVVYLNCGMYIYSDEIYKETALEFESMYKKSIAFIIKDLPERTLIKTKDIALFQILDKETFDRREANKEAAMRRNVITGKPPVLLRS